MAGFLDNVANMFRPTQQVTPMNAPPATPMAQVNPGAAAVVPPAGTDNSPPPNPMDELAKIWQTDPTSQQPVDPFAQPLFNTDPAKIAAAASKIDFTAQVNPELMAKAMSGSDPAAFMQVMNAIAQKAVATSTQLNAATIEQATARNNARIEQAMPDRMKRIQLESMQSENPVLQHAASQPLLKMVRSQIQMSQPGLSAVEINKMAENYLSGFASQLSGPTQVEQETARTKTAGTDWDTWASS